MDEQNDNLDLINGLAYRPVTDTGYNVQQLLSSNYSPHSGFVKTGLVLLRERKA